MSFIYLLLPIGFIFLIKGAGFLIDGASSIAKKLGVSKLIIGLTVVAFGTSIPELIVNIFASIKGNTDIAIGNILGSNIANILLVLGISAIISPLTVKRSMAWKEISLALFAVIAMALMANDALIDGNSISALTRTDGLILISFFIIFLYYTFGISRAESVDTTQISIHCHSFFSSILMVGAGLIGLTLGGKWIVDAAVILANEFGVSQALIGLTIVAVGTSLPELATSVVAAYRKNADIAVGNIVGSNIFNILFILGVSAIISSLPFSSALMQDVIMTIIATLLLLVLILVGRRHTLGLWQGAGFIALYVSYIVFLIAQEIIK